MTDVFPSKWSLIKGSSIIRTSGSLSRLAKPADASATDIRGLLADLTKIDPLGPRREHPWVNLTACADSAKELLSGFPDEAAERIGGIYATGLIAGFDGTVFIPGDGLVDRCRDEELGEAAAIGWRHGERIRLWWSSYHSVIDALFGGRP